MRLIRLSIVGWFAVCCGAAVLFAPGAGPGVARAQSGPAERDATTERVERAEQDYDQTCEAARERLIEALNQAVFRAADDGDLEQLEALEAQRAAFEEDGELPPARAVRREALAYHRALERAVDDLGRVYERAIRDYTRERRIDMARALRVRLGLLRAGAHVEIVAFGGHRYALVQQRLTWHEAKTTCEELGGYLVCVGSAEENEFVSDLLTADTHCWLGGTDEDSEGDWRWVDGSALDFQSWNPGEPRNGARRAQNHVYTNAGGGWDDIWPNAGIGFFVCEWDTPGVEAAGGD